MPSLKWQRHRQTRLCPTRVYFFRIFFKGIFQSVFFKVHFSKCIFQSTFFEVATRPSNQTLANKVREADRRPKFAFYIFTKLFAHVLGPFQKSQILRYSE